MNNYKLYTTKGCILCERVKILIISQKLDVEMIQANESDIEYFRKKGIRSFPILKIDERKYISGSNVGNYIAMNIEELRKK